ncbi:hypothetical protein CPB85DRAFT_606843 [Mucidula mucida]|nr:hypothetical protein CPB85DRAFT_606843 [Mucidula mucida]
MCSPQFLEIFSLSLLAEFCYTSFDKRHFLTRRLCRTGKLQTSTCRVTDRLRASRLRRAEGWRYYFAFSRIQLSIKLVVPPAASNNVNQGGTWI